MSVTRRIAIGGAAAVISALGAVSLPVSVAQAAPVSVSSGMEINIDETLITVASCTLGAVVSPTTALTAAHCGTTGEAVFDSSGDQIGTITANLIGRQADIAVITLAPDVRAAVDPIDWSPGFYQGQAVSKDGISTGKTVGTVTDPTLTLRTAHGFSLAPPFFLTQSTLSIGTNIHSVSGDSGSGIRDADGDVVGILSSGATADDTQFTPVSLVPETLR